jgi:hypothetical protein
MKGVRIEDANERQKSPFGVLQCAGPVWQRGIAVVLRSVAGLARQRASGHSIRRI